MLGGYRWLTSSGPHGTRTGWLRVSPGMRPVLVFLAALAVTAGCSANGASKAVPTVTVTATTPTAAATLSAEDQSSAQLACFGWTTYQKAEQIGNPKTLQYATTAQQPTAGMSDPRWSRVAGLQPDEAMQVLGGLCAEIHYSEQQ